MFKWLSGKKDVKAAPQPVATITAPKPEPTPAAVVQAAAPAVTPKVLYVPLNGGEVPVKEYPAKQAQAQWLGLRSKVQGSLVVFVDVESHGQFLDAHKPESVIDPIGARDFDAVRNKVRASDVYQHLSEFRPPNDSVIADGEPLKAFCSLTHGQPTAHLGVVPTTEQWRVPGYLRFGNWASVPADHEYLAFCKLWFEEHGATPAVVGSNFIEFWLDQPVSDPEVAIDLAIQMYSLCPAVVSEGVASVEALARSLMGANVWYFWWD